MPTHTQINTCKNCGKVEHWEVLQSISIHDWRQWCSDCLRKIGGNTTEPSDANGYADIDVIIIGD
jgi:hypothetical protein